MNNIYKYYLYICMIKCMKISIKYYLEVRKSLMTQSRDIAWPLVLSCSYSGIRMKMHLGIKVPASHWNSGEQMISNVSDQSGEMNSYLEGIREVVKNSFTLLQKDSEIPASELLKAKIKGSIPVFRRGFFDSYIEFMEEKHLGWAKSTYLKIRTLYNLLREFDAYRSEELKLHIFDSNDFIQLESFFINVKGFAQITTQRYMSMIKWFLNWAVEKKYYFNPALRAMKPMAEVQAHTLNEVIYLNRDELFGLFGLDGLTRREERIRDIFCFICFTGIRYAVLKKIRKHDVRGDYLNLPNNARQESMPLNQYAIKILTKYTNLFFRGETLFPAFSELTVNKYLRKLAEKAELSRFIHPENGSKPGGSVSSKHHNLSIGIARNTFIMNGLLLGVSEESLVRIAGGNSSFMLKRYKSQLENKDRLQMNKFNDL